MDALDEAVPPARLRLSQQHWEQMRQHVAQQAPKEACGLVAGENQRSQAVLPIRNALDSPVRFRMDPVEQLHAFDYLDSQNWDLLAIYHSHPAGPDHPSETDLAEAAYPQAVNLIWFRVQGKWACRAFLIREARFEEIPILPL